MTKNDGPLMVLSRMPGVLGGIACDRDGRLLQSTLPVRIDPATLTRLAARLLSMLAAARELVPGGRRLSIGWRERRLEAILVGGGLLAVLISREADTSALDTALQQAASILLEA